MSAAEPLRALPPSPAGDTMPPPRAAPAEPGVASGAITAGLAASLALAACAPASDSASALPAAFDDRSAAKDVDLPRQASALAAPPASVSLPLPDATALLDWAEQVFPQHFPGHRSDERADPYVYRHYPASGNYVGVAGNDVYVLGPVSGGALWRAGSLADFASAVHNDVRPLDAADAAAARLLLQAQFSASDAEIARVREIGARAWVAEQTAAPRPLSGVQWLDRRGCYSPTVRKGFHTIAWPAYWMAWGQMMSAPDAVRVRATLALSEYFVVSLPAIGGHWVTYSMAAYWDVLADNAFGNFRTLLEKITLNHAMGLFLNTANNAKEDESGRQPDENYAREVMQLFTIGLHELNADGTERQGSNGKPIETYDNDDVTNLARVFTGYVPAPDPGPRLPTDDPLLGGTIGTRIPNISPMVLVAARHSTLESRFLDAVVPAGTDGASALRIALDALFRHRNVGPFFCKQMIQRLVTSNPSPAYVARVSAVFDDNGQGVRGDLRAVFSAIWLDPEASGAGSTEAARIGKLRELPVRIAQWGRTFASDAARLRWDIERLYLDRGLFLNQTVLAAPSVFNFFRPGYVPPSTALAERGWVAPEMQITDESSVAMYLNWMQKVVQVGLGRLTSDEVFSPSSQYIGAPLEFTRAEYAAELPLAHVAPALVRRLNLLLCAGALPADVQQMMIDALNANPLTAASSTQARYDRVAAAVLMVMACPEYLVQH